MKDTAIFLIFLAVVWLVWKLLRSTECDHDEQVYFDAEGDPLSGDQSDACFCRCVKCGRVGVIPSGFQSDAHFDNYLYRVEQGGSRVIDKIKDD